MGSRISITLTPIGFLTQAARDSDTRISVRVTPSIIVRAGDVLSIGGVGRSEEVVVDSVYDKNSELSYVLTAQRGAGMSDALNHVAGATVWKAERIEWTITQEG